MLRDMQGYCKEIDVICEHKVGGSIIPLKLRFEDEEGEFQCYAVRGYRQLNSATKEMSTEEAIAQGIISGHLLYFDVKVAVFGREKTLRLIYSPHNGIWRLDM